jgi:ribosome-binding factor A
MSYRKEKIIEMIHRLASSFIKEQANTNPLITVTKIVLSDDLKEATIFISVLPDNQQDKAINFLKRKRHDFKVYFKNNIQISPIPFFDFQIDLGEKNRQRIDEISHNL